MKRKRLSNKKRKLIYIRQKNQLRRGGSLLKTFKVSNGMLNFDDNYLKNQIDVILLEASKYYKLELTFDLRVGMVDDDFIRELQTVALLITKRINYENNN